MKKILSYEQGGDMRVLAGIRLMGRMLTLCTENIIRMLSLVLTTTP